MSDLIDQYDDNMKEAQKAIEAEKVEAGIRSETALILLAAATKEIRALLDSRKVMVSYEGIPNPGGDTASASAPPAVKFDFHGVLEYLDGDKGPDELFVVKMWPIGSDDYVLKLVAKKHHGEVSAWWGDYKRIKKKDAECYGRLDDLLDHVATRLSALGRAWILAENEKK